MIEKETEKDVEMKNKAERTQNKRNEKMKIRYDKSTKEVEFSLGDRVIVKRPPANKTDTLFSMEPLTITDIKGSMVTARRIDGTQMTRNISHFKKFNES